MMKQLDIFKKQPKKDERQHVRMVARYVDFSTMEELHRVEFDELLSEEEAEQLTCLLFGSEYFYPSDLRWKNHDLYHRIEEKGEALLKNAYQPSADILLHTSFHWAKGERERLTAGCRFLTQEDIDAKCAFLESIGSRTPTREEVLDGIADRFIWKEVWTRETGHMWTEYTLLKRKPCEEELDYADCSHYAIRLSSLSTKAIIDELKANTKKT